MEQFWVKTGARIHLGQLDLSGSLGRLYGGIGLAIDQPALELTVEKSNRLMIISPESEQRRIQNISKKYLEFYQLPGAKINLRHFMPSHSGLGSGTQLALALGFALTRVYQLQPSLAELAGITDRESSRSGIGVAAFAQGGFLLDGGVPVSQVTGKFKVPPLLTRIHFPEEWAIILALPDKEEKMFGLKEEKTFKSLLPMEEHISGIISRLILMKLLPGLIEKDLKSFGQAVTEIQKHLGNYFAPVQGGQYACALGAKLSEYLLSQGAAGVGQSSWGPAIYGFTDQEKKADLLESTRNFIGNRGRVWAVNGINHGANWGWRLVEEDK
ncbi:MAG: beta-ribofuranosylaminobenzene 5'-phosphate synthase family protein [Dehalobacterium sp.]